MRKVRMVLLCAAVFLTASLASAQSELLTNGTFDGSLSGWTKVGSSNSATYVTSPQTTDKAGSGAVQITSLANSDTPGYWISLIQTVPVVAGSVYTLKTNIKGLSNDAAAFLSWYRADGSFLAGAYPTSPFVGPSNNFVTASTTLTAPAGAASAQVELCINVIAGSSAIFDDVSLTGQAASNCTYDLNKSADTFAPAGGTNMITVFTSASNCPWNATAGAAFVHITGGASGVGPGFISYSVDPNNGAPRSAAITVTAANFSRIVNIVQAGVSPPTAALVAIPETIHSGEKSTLSWSTSDATTVTLFDGVTNKTVNPLDSLVVGPTVDTTYTITAQSGVGSTSSSRRVKVVTASKPVLGPFIASADTVATGASVTLSWSSSGGTSASIDQGVGTLPSPAAGSIPVAMKTTTTFTLTVRGDGGATTATRTVKVYGLPAALTAPFSGTGIPGKTDGPPGTASFTRPFAVAAVPSSVVATGTHINGPTTGTVFFVLDSNHTIRRIAPDGTTSTYAGISGTAGSANGNRLGEATFNFTNYTGALVAYPDESLDVIDYSGLQRHIDAATAKVTNACPSCAAVSIGDGIYRLADGTIFASSAGLNKVIRRDGKTGAVVTIGTGVAGRVDGPYNQAQFNRPGGLTVDTSSGTVYVLDMGNNAVRKIAPDLSVSTMTVTGGSQTNGGELSLACCSGGGIVPGPGGSVDITDPGSNTIKHVAPDGSITTVAGSGDKGSANGEGGGASFDTPLGLAPGANGSLVVTDTNNNTVRSVDVPGNSCSDPTTVCLLNGRFTARVQYHLGFDNGTPETYAFVKRVTGFSNTNFETVFFYFNDPNNIEVLLKMLDQGNVDTAGNPTIALLYGTATPLRILVTITDTKTGVAKTYESAFNAMRGQTDFTAFKR